MIVRPEELFNNVYNGSFVMGKIGKPVLIVKNPPSHLGFKDITYSYLIEIIPRVFLIDSVLFLVLLSALFLGDLLFTISLSDLIRLLYFVWITIVAVIGCLTTLIFVIGVKEILKRKNDAPSLIKVLFFGAFTLALFSYLIYWIMLTFY